MITIYARLVIKVLWLVINVPTIAILFFSYLKTSGLLPAFASRFIQEVLGPFPGCCSLEFQCHVSTHYNITIVCILVSVKTAGSVNRNIEMVSLDVRGGRICFKCPNVCAMLRREAVEHWSNHRMWSSVYSSRQTPPTEGPTAISVA